MTYKCHGFGFTASLSLNQWKTCCSKRSENHGKGLKDIQKWQICVFFCYCYFGHHPSFKIPYYMYFLVNMKNMNHYTDIIMTFFLKRLGRSHAPANIIFITFVTHQNNIFHKNNMFSVWNISIRFAQISFFVNVFGYDKGKWKISTNVFDF